MGVISAHHEVPDADQRVQLRLAWPQFVQLMKARGESPANRIIYLDGVLEIMAPSQDHEFVKSSLARFLELWALESNIELEAFGSWTVTNARSRTAVEPDECYILGAKGSKRRPDLAIEVQWSRGGIDKLEVYRRLQVPEVWFWEDGALELVGPRLGATSDCAPVRFCQSSTFRS